VTDDEFLQNYVGTPPKELNDQILLSEYDSKWPDLFLREAKRIRAILGSGALMVEHVGSTSVPGLAAKPIIDILLVVQNSVNEAEYVPLLESHGYVLRIREPHWHEHRVFKGPDIDINLHVFSRDNSEVERMLVFRDWLRSHPKDRELYLQKKRELAGRKWKYVQYYADAKSEIVEEIIRRAESQKKRQRLGAR